MNGSIARLTSSMRGPVGHRERVHAFGHVLIDGQSCGGAEKSSGRKPVWIEQ
jgi:hypothetical protein